MDGVRKRGTYYRRFRKERELLYSIDREVSSPDLYLDRDKVRFIRFGLLAKLFDKLTAFKDRTLLCRLEEQMRSAWAYQIWLADPNSTKPYPHLSGWYTRYVNSFYEHPIGRPSKREMKKTNRANALLSFDLGVD